MENCNKYNSVANEVKLDEIKKDIHNFDNIYFNYTINRKYSASI